MISKQIKNIKGQKFGKLTVISLDSIKNKYAYWNCTCECGGTKCVSAKYLLRKSIKSCGCIANGKTHGKATSQIYKVWSAMKRRCYNINDHAFKDYGGRGITVCEKWLKFEGFYEDMGERPSLNHSIDRINNDGNYTKSNCRWATQLEQGCNKRNSVLIEYMNENLSISEWAIKLNLGYNTIYSRFRKKLPIEKILFKGRLYDI